MSGSTLARYLNQMGSQLSGQMQGRTPPIYQNPDRQGQLSELMKLQMQIESDPGFQDTFGRDAFGRGAAAAARKKYEAQQDERFGRFSALQAEQLERKAAEEKQARAAEAAAKQQDFEALESIYGPQQARAIMGGYAKPGDFAKKDERSSQQKNAEWLLSMSPAAREQVMKLPIFGGQTINIGDNEGPTEFEKALAKKDAEDYQAYRSEADIASGNLKTLETLEQATRLFETGKLQEAVNIIGQYAGTDVAANMQAFNSIVGDLVMQELNKMKGAAQVEERKYLQSLMPGVGNDPRANAEIIKYLRSKNQNAVDRYVQATAYADEKNNLRGFQPSYKGSIYQGTSEETQEYTTEQAGAMSDEELLEIWNGRN